MTKTKTPIDHAVDLFFYAPLGLAVAVRDLVPTLVERGRRQVDPQVDVARTIGQMAVSQGRSRAEKVVERAWAQAAATLHQLGVLDDHGDDHGDDHRDDHEGDDEGDGAPSGDAVARPAGPPPAAPARMEGDAPPAAAPHGGGTPAVSLSIPDYDSLSASQVVPRLSSLSVHELEAVRSYEESHRARRTILNKIAQLEAG